MFIGALDPVSNKATWTVNYELRDSDDELVDLSSVDEITIEIVNPTSGESELTATLGDGVTVVETGVFSWSFTSTQMRTLCAQTYHVGCTLTQDDETIQLLIGTVAVLDGLVT